MHESSIERMQHFFYWVCVNGGFYQKLREMESEQLLTAGESHRLLDQFIDYMASDIDDHKKHSKKHYMKLLNYSQQHNNSVTCWIK